MSKKPSFFGVGAEMAVPYFEVSFFRGGGGEGDARSRLRPHFLRAVLFFFREERRGNNGGALAEG